MLYLPSVKWLIAVLFFKVFLVPRVVTWATRAPAMAKKSSLCDPTNKEPRRAKIPSGAAVFYRCGWFLTAQGSFLSSVAVAEVWGAASPRFYWFHLGFQQWSVNNLSALVLSTVAVAAVKVHVCSVWWLAPSDPEPSPFLPFQPCLHDTEYFIPYFVVQLIWLYWCLWTGHDQTILLFRTIFVWITLVLIDCNWAVDMVPNRDLTQN